MTNTPAHFRAQAQRAQHLADNTLDGNNRAAWGRIAEQFVYLAELTERIGPWQPPLSAEGGVAARDHEPPRAGDDRGLIGSARGTRRNPS